MKFRIFLIVFCILFNLPAATFAVEVAPRISDREIVEKLVTLEAGQAALRSEIKAGQAAFRSEMKAGQDALRSEKYRGSSLRLTFLYYAFLLRRIMPGYV